MIKEAFCSFEVSKLLKEKGFDEECFGAYSETNHSITMFNGKIKNSEYGISLYTTPTHQMAMAWLREAHGIYIVFFHTNKSGWWYNITDMKDSYVFYSSEKTMCSYEDVVEAALKYVLENLI